MAKKKLQHFSEMKTFSCVFEPENEEMRSDNNPIKGRWKRDYFQNANPITVELGCGKGEYTIALARMHPNRNFVGIDVKGARLWRGAKTVAQSKMKNVAFLRIKIEFLTHFFAPSEIEELWLTFSDPQLGDHKGSKRLTAQKFLERYRQVLSHDGNIYVKTDSDFLYSKTLEVIAAGEHRLIKKSPDIYGRDFTQFSPAERDILGVKTFYEQMFLEREEKINYIHFQLNDAFHQARREA